MIQREAASKGTSPGISVRYLYMDFLRVLACFLVIVNHTNSYVFKGAALLSPLWYVSIVWYYFSKIAVPVFVMVSGACLLPRKDSYRRTGQRLLRMVLVLLLFSYGYYLFDLWKTHWTWGKALDIPGFLRSIWERRITDSFWYLYFYVGLLVMLPLLQRLAGAMEKKDFPYLLGISFGANALWPLVVHYIPGLALPGYFDLPLFSIFIGLFFAGHYLHAYVKSKSWHPWACGGVIVLSLLISAALTALEIGRVLPGEKYWFMDERTAPAFPVILCTLAVMLLCKTAFSLRGEASPRLVKAFTALGSFAFPIYLLQDLLIAETRYRIFVPLSGQINPFFAALLWEAGVFLALLPVAWVLKRIPGVKKIL